MKNEPDSPTKNALEWTVFGLSGLLIAGVIGALVWFGLNMEEGPAEIVVTFLEPVAANGRVRLPVEVENRGRSVATAVQVLVIAGSGASEREAEFSVDFVPRGATRKASVSFAGEEIPEQLRWEVLGYAER